MKYLACIDDTDMPGTRGTGWLAQALCDELKERGLAEQTTAISRHQLFLHDDIPYTSHNSAMCFELCMEKAEIDPVIDYMGEFLQSRSQTGSDPGLCVAGLAHGLHQEQLIQFGVRAKEQVATKRDAYALAHQTGIHLSEHGGSGQGVIGALAGIGLRLSGNDGRYRGWHDLGRPGNEVRVDVLCGFPFVDGVVSPSGAPLPAHFRVAIGSEKTKTVRLGGKRVVVTVDMNGSGQNGIRYRTITKKEAKSY